jgi:hypothetical protein
LFAAAGVAGQQQLNRLREPAAVDRPVRGYQPTAGGPAPAG